MLSDFTPGEGVTWASKHMDVDGEADYGISATIMNPPDDRKDYESDLEEAQEAVDTAEHELSLLDEDSDEFDAAQTTLEEARSILEDLEESDPGHWSESNGAWMICEVFPVDVDDMRSSRPQYTSLSDAFSADLIALAREV